LRDYFLLFNKKKKSTKFQITIISPPLRSGELKQIVNSKQSIVNSCHCAFLPLLRACLPVGGEIKRGYLLKPKPLLAFLPTGRRAFDKGRNIFPIYC